MTVKLIREKQDSGAWETVVDAGGGGGSQDLAQVLAVGGDPDGNPITGAVTISPTADVNGLQVGGVTDQTASLVLITTPADPSQNFPVALEVKDNAGVQRFMVDGYGDVLVTLDGSQEGSFHINSEADGGIFSAWADPSKKLAFFGSSGSVQPVVPLTTPSVQDVIDALVSLGLVAQHD